MRKWWPLTAVCAGACMLLVDVTIVNVALPDMARQLDTTSGPGPVTAAPSSASRTVAPGCPSRK
jgi:hypothetical protein